MSCLASLNSNQRDKLKKFRESVSDVITSEHDDSFLLRWMIAKNFDVNAAKEMLIKHFKWRKDWDIDNILTDYVPPEVLRIYWPLGFLGYSKEGYPVNISLPGKLDLKGVTRSAKKKDVIKFIAFKMETNIVRMKTMSSKLDKDINKAVFISDMDGMSITSLTKAGLDLMSSVAEVIEANYPDILHRSYIVNAPRFFPFVYGTIKRFLREETRKKINVITGDWRRQLREEVLSPDQLPKHWGGELSDSDGDSRCPSKIPPGGKIPESYYLKVQNLIDEDKLISVTVHKGSVHQETVHVTSEGSYIRWAFDTKSYDIKFGIVYQEQNDSNPVNVLPAEHVSSYLVPHDGTIECQQKGFYILQWDNTYSWLRAKKLRYTFEVVVTPD